MRINKSIKNFINYFLGPLLFIWLSFSIYAHIRNQPHLGASWQAILDSFTSVRILYLLGSVLLVAVNWGLEAWKWQISVATVHRVGFARAFEAVLSGVTFSVTMPNRVGEYLGRMMYLPEGRRLRTISVTIVGSIAQLLSTLFTGWLGLIILKKPLLQNFPQIVIWYQFLLYGLAALILLTGYIYFNASGGVRFFDRWIRSRKYHYLVEALGAFNRPLLIRVLLISMLRYLVFLVQYILLFYFFGVNAGIAITAWVMSVVFLSLAIIPSITLIEIGVRGEITLQLMGMFSGNSLGIAMTSVMIWVINLILPAIAGSLLMLNFRVFRKEGETVI